MKLFWGLALFISGCASGVMSIVAGNRGDYLWGIAFVVLAILLAISAGNVIAHGMVDE